jgi:hypothetical protein
MRRLDPSLLPAEVLKQIPSYNKAATEKVGSAPVKEEEEPIAAPVASSSSEAADPVNKTEDVVEVEETEETAPAQTEKEEEVERGDEENKGLF